MEHHEFIAKAKTHFAGTVAAEAIPPSPDDFPVVRVRETELLDFESNNRKHRVFVLLDRATGDFVAGGSNTCNKT